MRTVACPLEREVVAVHGDDAVAFLQGQLSQDVEALAVGTSAPSFLLQPTGKVDAWLRVTRTGPDALLLDVDAGWGEPVLARLRRFLLRTKADLELARWQGLAVRGPEAAAAVPADLPAGALVLAAPWPELPGVDVLGPALELSGPDDLEPHRIAAGVPAMGAEVGESTIPAELGQWAIDASVSFTKGCYTGQELVARIDSRGGNVPHPVRGLRLQDEVPVGAAVAVDGSEVGRTTSAARHPDLGPIALAVVARSVVPGAEVQVGGGDAPAVAGTVVELPQR
jgi:folate-binding protein YgfZ